MVKKAAFQSKKRGIPFTNLNHIDLEPSHDITLLLVWPAQFPHFYHFMSSPKRVILLLTLQGFAHQRLVLRDINLWTLNFFRTRIECKDRKMQVFLHCNLRRLQFGGQDISTSSKTYLYLTPSISLDLSSVKAKEYSSGAPMLTHQPSQKSLFPNQLRNPCRIHPKHPIK